MNLDFGELFKRTPTLFVVLGAILLTFAAIGGGVSIGGQALPIMDATWRYILAGSGAVLIIVGIVLVLLDYRQAYSKKKDAKSERELPKPVVELLSDSKLTSCGFSHAFRIPTDDPLRQKRVYELIDQEVKGHKKLRLAASSGFSYLNPNGKVWKARLGKLITGGIVEMNVVLESPFSDFAITRALANEVEHHQWEEKQRPENLIELLKYPNISIKVTDVSVNCSLFFTSEAAYYDPYLWALPQKPGRTENNFWVFEFDKISDQARDCYDLLERHFNFLVHYSIPLEELLHTPENDTELPKGKEFHYLFMENPEFALNRYTVLTEKFRQDLRTRLKRKR